MRSIETEADTIDEAIAKALSTLGVGRDQVEIEILSDAAKGLFGFGGRKASVRATVRAPLMAEIGAETAGVRASVSRETDAPAMRRTVSRETGTPSTARVASGGTDGADTQRDVSRETGRRPAHGNVSRETDTGRPPVNVSRETLRPSEPVSPAVRERARAVLADLLAHLGVRCTIDVRTGGDPGVLLLAVNGDSGGLLIGRRGQTLDAIEYIVNRIVARDDAGAVRVTIDIERYRERRQEYLTTLAHRLADKVRQTGRVVTLNPMSPRDRRTVHVALHSDASVATRSEGDGHYRRVLIVPADRPRRSRQPGRPSA